jgi:hypothetical protein
MIWMMKEPKSSRMKIAARSEGLKMLICSSGMKKYTILAKTM